MSNNKRTASQIVLAILLASLLAILACSVEGANSVSTSNVQPAIRANNEEDWKNRELTKASDTDGVYKIVCNSGGLNVRKCAGTSCMLALEFPIQDGKAIVASSWTKRSEDGGVWIYIVEPVFGWVNIRYLCDPDSL